MAVEHLTDEDYAAKLRDADMAVVDFYAAWCGQCVIFSRRFVELSEDFPHVRFFVCDSDLAPALRGTVEIDEVPYFGLYRGGEFIGGFSTTDEVRFRAELRARFDVPTASATVH